jgi:hypothetical protein
MFESVHFALAAPRDHGVSSALGLDPIQQPHRTTRRARGDLQFGVQPVGVMPLSLCDVVGEAGGLVDGFGEIFGEVSDVASRFFSAAQGGPALSGLLTLGSVKPRAA